MKMSKQLGEKMVLGKSPKTKLNLERMVSRVKGRQQVSGN